MEEEGSWHNGVLGSIIFLWLKSGRVRLWLSYSIVCSSCPKNREQ